MCALCEREPATEKLPHMYVCPACKRLVQEMADAKLAAVVDWMFEENEREGVA
jgi:hypothetical protein